MNQNCDMDRVEELNQRILGRNSGYGNQDVLLDVRSQATKYTFPLQAATPKCSQPVLKYATSTNINTDDSKYPWNGYVSNINNESILRNQVFALQRSPQSVYVPSSTSDLYISTIPSTNQNQNLNLNLNLNQNQGFIQTQVLFNNDTRSQMKDS